MLQFPTDTKKAEKHRGILMPLIFIALAAGFTLPCRGQQNNDNSGLLSEPNRLKFADFLFSQKDYLRAAQEYKECLRKDDNDTVLYKYASSLFGIGSNIEAADNFKPLFFSRELSDLSKLMFFRAYFNNGDYKFFRDLTDQSNYLTPKYSKEIKRLKYTSYLFDNTPLPAQDEFVGAFDDSVQSQISHFYYQKKYPRLKSGATAAILSAFLPGLGKIYTGEYGDGITSFIATGLCAFLSVSDFQARHNFRGWLFAGLTAFFYGGNIYGSAASAQIVNAHIRINLDRDIKAYFSDRNYFLPRMGN